jgi:hypothetical protein
MRFATLGRIATTQQRVDQRIASRIISPLMMPKIPALTPMPRVGMPTAVSVKPGCLRRR